MTWQGIPYPLSNILESSYLTVSKIPTVVVDTGFAWENVFGSLIAGAIPAYIAWYTIKKNIKALEVDRQRQQDSFDKDRAAQLDIASKNLNAQVLSNNRQEWIRNLRELIAEYLALTSELLPIQHTFIISKYFYEDVKNTNTNSRSVLAGISSQDKFLDARDRLRESMKRLNESRVKEKLLISKIKLMLNPKEKWYGDLNICFAEVSICYNSFLNHQEDDYGEAVKKMGDISDKILSISQEILKYEWERVKLIV